MRAFPKWLAMVGLAGASCLLAACESCDEYYSSDNNNDLYNSGYYDTGPQTTSTTTTTTHQERPLGLYYYEAQFRDPWLPRYTPLYDYPNGYGYERVHDTVEYDRYAQPHYSAHVND